VTGGKANEEGDEQRQMRDTASKTTGDIGGGKHHQRRAIEVAYEERSDGRESALGEDQGDRGEGKTQIRGERQYMQR